MRGPQLTDMTHRHLPSAMQGVTAMGGMHISFSWDVVRIENSADPLLNGTTERRLFVIKSPKGDRSTVSKRPISEENAARAYPEEWAQFSMYGDVPTSGTPLSELPGVTQSQISYLGLFNIRSVEDLIEIGPDVAAKEMGLEGNKVYRLAEAFDKRRSGSGDLPAIADLQARMEIAEKARADQDVAKNERIRQLEAQIAAFQQMQNVPAAAQHGNQTAQVQGAPGVVTPTPANMQMSAEDDEFGYGNVEDMPDPFSSGAADADPNDNLTGDMADTMQEGL